MDNFFNEMQNEENQAKINLALDPWLYKMKLFLYVTILLLFLLVLSSVFTNFQINNLLKKNLERV